MTTKGNSSKNRRRDETIQYSDADLTAAVSAALRAVRRRSDVPQDCRSDRARRPTSTGLLVKGLPEDETAPSHSEIRSALYLNRKALLPWKITAIVVALGLMGWFAGWVWGRPAIAAATFSGTLALIAAIAWLPARAAISASLPTGWKPWAAAVLANAVAWIGVVTASGVDWLSTSWLLVSTVAFGARWWNHIRPGYPFGPATKPSRDDATEAALLEENFRIRLAGKGCLLEGATIDDVTPYEHGLEGLIQLVGGKQSIEMMQAAKPRICTALDYYDPDITFEHLPASDDVVGTRSRPSQVRLRIVTRSPIRGGVLFDRPEYHDGKILLGPYSDGIGNALFTLYTEDSMETGFVLGSRGSGKSRLLETIALTALACSPTVLIYLDGQDGASSPLLWEHALWHGGRDEVPHVIAGLKGMQVRRGQYNRYFGLTGFTPSHDRPGILIIVDECHRIFDADTVEFFATLAREGRKLGMGMLAASQAATVAEAFAGSDVLRSNLVAGNGIALRTMSRVQQNVFPGLGFNLTTLPKLPGYGYTVDEGDTGAVRTAPFRARNLLDARKAEDKQLPDGVRVAEDWFASLPEQVLDPSTAAAAGTHFSRRHERAEAAHAALADIFETTSGEGKISEIDAAGSTIRAGRSPQIIRFPTWDSASPTPMPDAPEGVGPAQAAAYKAVAAGDRTPTQIAARLGVSAQAVHKTLTKLTAAGHLTTDRGRYALPAQARV